MKKCFKLISILILTLLLLIFILDYKNIYNQIKWNIKPIFTTETRIVSQDEFVDWLFYKIEESYYDGYITADEYDYFQITLFEHTTKDALIKHYFHFVQKAGVSANIEWPKDWEDIADK
jgi:hypothetical protein